ncbi:hypothetical protein BDR26DRAFT_874785 [Obelidium mucronatum]|nr:hypothetical protein BDR26DRAFT_874785 [Obelidium mucronatum]
MQLTTVLAAIAFTVTQVSAHGMMNWPIARILPGDQQNGYTFNRAASNRNTAVHPDSDINCAYLPQGPIFTQVMAPGAATLDYTMTAFHLGGCVARISRDGQKTWEVIGEDPTCGVQAVNTSGRGSINVTIPDGTYQAVIRWTYTAANGGDPNEIFNNCADVTVAPSGTNKHLLVELMSGPSPWSIQLPKTPWQYQGSSCPVPGGTLCAGPGSSFINQCISLAAGGGWTGGSSYYQYQCPFGATCQTVNGVDACVGGAVVTSASSVTASTTATTIPPSVTAPSKSTTTTTTTTTTIPSTTKPTTTTTIPATTQAKTTTVATSSKTTSTTTTTTTTPAATTTTIVSGVQCYPAYVPGTVYPSAGAKVSFSNGNYVNKWWTQNEAPDSTKPNSVWTYEGSCGVVATTTTSKIQSVTLPTASGSPTSTPTSLVIIPGTPCPVLADNSLRLPYPAGKTCADVKHECQAFCSANQWYNIQRNQCFGEDANNTAVQWCQCNDVTYYGVAFGKPTTACPV